MLILKKQFLKLMTEYKLIPLTVDIIIERDAKILMIRRCGDTFNNYLAFPGGFVDYGETVEHAAIREAKEEVNIDIVPRHILGVYSDSNRDPRGHVISVAFVCDFEGDPLAGDDAGSFEWIPLDSELEFAFDHGKIFNDYKNWKQNAGTYWSSK